MIDETKMVGETIPTTHQLCVCVSPLDADVLLLQSSFLLLLLCAVLSLGFPSMASDSVDGW